VAHETSKITTPLTLLKTTGGVEGDLLYFNGTNWARIARGTNGQVLRSTAATINWETVALTNHNLLSATHSDTTAAAAVRGDIIVADATPAWRRVAKGTTGYPLVAGANEPAYAQLDTAGLAASYAGGMEYVGEHIPGADTATLSVNVSSTYLHYLVFYWGQFNTGESSVCVRLNADSGNNYAWVTLNGNASTTSSTGSASDSQCVVGIAPTVSTAANTCGIVRIDKRTTGICASIRGDSVSQLMTTGNPDVRIAGGIWNNTANNVTSIQLISYDGYSWESDNSRSGMIVFGTRE
jgi:hypothetical protein